MLYTYGLQGTMLKVMPIFFFFAWKLQQIQAAMNKFQLWNTIFLYSSIGNVFLSASKNALLINVACCTHYCHCQWNKNYPGSVLHPLFGHHKHSANMNNNACSCFFFPNGRIHWPLFCMCLYVKCHQPDKTKVLYVLLIGRFNLYWHSIHISL